jgi:hypothetical protein
MSFFVKVLRHVFIIPKITKSDHDSDVLSFDSVVWMCFLRLLSLLITLCLFNLWTDSDTIWIYLLWPTMFSLLMMSFIEVAISTLMGDFR